MEANDEAASRAAALLEFRRLRSSILPSELFGESGWDLLLELFVAEAKGRSLTGEEVARRVGAAPSTFSRWLMYLDKQGLVLRDGNGNLTDKLVLSALALNAIEKIMQMSDRRFSQNP